MLKFGFRFLVGPLVLLISFAGILHGIRAGAAQYLYYEARYGTLQDRKDSTERILETCEKAHRLYPWNYLFCAVATDAAFLKADSSMDAASRSRFLTAAGKWCDYGLALNPYNRDLNLRKAGLIGAVGDNSAKAAAHWAGYTDWHYWNPVNHCILGKMYAWAGEFKNAEDCARLIEKSAYHKSLREAIDGEKAKKNKPLF